MGTEATPSPLSALGNALHLPNLIQPPPRGTGTGTANWDPQLGTERFGRTLTPLRTIVVTDHQPELLQLQLSIAEDSLFLWNPYAYEVHAGVRP